MYVGLVVVLHVKLVVVLYVRLITLYVVIMVVLYVGLADLYVGLAVLYVCRTCSSIFFIFFYKFLPLDDERKIKYNIYR